MNKSSYILRIDDACPTMRRSSFERIRTVCDNVDIKPIIGIVPDNRDPKLVIDREWTDFWSLMRNLANNGWIIAQHGYQHVYNERKTEFAGLPYDQQIQKISSGQKIIAEKMGYVPTWFMAPSHSIDINTCKALHTLSFTHITDGIALYPFIKHGLTWVPQQLWRPISMPFGIWTICLHPNTMNDSQIDAVLAFVQLHAKQFKNVSFTPQKSLFTIPMRIVWATVLFIKHIWPI